MLTVCWDSQGVLFAILRCVVEMLNSASYFEVLLKLCDAIRRKRPGQLARGALLHHDNAKPHTARATQERIQALQWELPEHPSYSPYLAFSELRLFRPLKTALVANVSLMTKRLNRRCGSGSDNNQNTSALRVWAHW
jgi:hypothetical protein